MKKKISIHMVDERKEVPEPSKEDIVLYKVKDPIIGVGKTGNKYYFHSDGRIERKGKDE